MAKRLLTAIGITILAFALSAVLLAPFSFSASTLVSAPEKNDFEMTDFYAIVADSRLVRTLDPDIVIINIDECDRGVIAETLEKVALCNPAVVGLDVMFNDARNDDNDARLIAAIAECPNLVLPVGVAPVDDDSFALSDTTFFHSEVSQWPMGVTNLPTKFAGGTVREFKSSFNMTDGSTLPSFAALIADKYTPDKALEFKARNNDTELINYPSIDYRVYDPDEISEHTDDISGRIVLIGAMSELPDLHTTPIHSQMPGVGIHARAISTILNGQYLTRVAKPVNWILAFILCMTVVTTYVSIKGNIRGLLMRILQVGLLYLIIVAGYICYVVHNVIIDLSYALLMLTFGLFACDVWNGCEAIGKNIYSRYRNKFRK